MSEHLDPAELAGLASLDASDPARRDAQRHASTCLECEKAWLQALAMFALIDELPSPPPPSPVMLAALADGIAADLQGATAALPPKPSALGLFPVVGALGAAWLVIAALGHAHATLSDGSRWLASLPVAVVAAVLGAAGTGRASPRVAVGLAVATSAVFAGLAGGGGELLGQVGIHCLAIELGAACAPLGVAMWLATRAGAGASAARYAALAGSGALAAHAALEFSCEGHGSLDHLLVFHTAGVALAAVLGAAAGRVHARRLGATLHIDGHVK